VGGILYKYRRERRDRGVSEIKNMKPKAKSKKDISLCFGILDFA
jgi:hypothetical protein